MPNISLDLKFILYVCNTLGVDYMIRFFLTILLCGFISCPILVNAQKSASATYSVVIEPTDTIEITVADNRIILNNVPVGSKLQVYSVVGVKVKEIEIKQPSGEYILNLAKGYYIIRIGDVVRKIAIR